MTPLLEAAAELQTVCGAHGWRYCFIGGLAVLRWGEPRETVDVDRNSWRPTFVARGRRLPHQPKGVQGLAGVALWPNKTKPTLFLLNLS